MGVFDVTALLDDAADDHAWRPAVACGDDEADFERFGESVQWLAADLAALGVQGRQRIGLCATSGREFLLAFYALLRLDVVAVPIDPFDDESLSEAAELGLHSVILHRDQDAISEDVAAQLSGVDFCPVFDVADEFSLFVLAHRTSSDQAGGVILRDLAYRYWPGEDLEVGSAALCGSLGLDSGDRVVFCGPWSSPSAVLLILACAVAGSCIQVVDDPASTDAVLDVIAAGAAVVFAEPVLMNRVVHEVSSRLADVAAVRLVLPHGEVLPEVTVRRVGLMRKDFGASAVYGFAGAVPLTDLDSDCYCEPVGLRGAC